MLVMSGISSSGTSRFVNASRERRVEMKDGIRLIQGDQPFSVGTHRDRHTFLVNYDSISEWVTMRSPWYSRYAELISWSSLTVSVRPSTLRS